MTAIPLSRRLQNVRLPRTAAAIVAAALSLTVHAAVPAEVIIVEAEEDGVVAVENVFALQANQIEQWVFPNQTLEQVRKNSGASLGVQIDFVSQVAELNPAQRTKLELAGRGDIHRFFEDFDAFKASMPRQLNQEDWGMLWQRVQPLQQRYAAGLHGPGSLFHRTIRSVLTAEQLQRFESMEQDRRQKHYRAAVRLAVVFVEARLPLTSAQRRKLTETMLAKSAAPKHDILSTVGTYFVLQTMANLPEEDLKPIFAEKEWRTFKSMLLPYKNVMNQFNGVQDF